ncbi:hypothetical protein PYCCODRAFT_1403824 [Trametes coccinea BRFM310]|uniref:Uncharacterized protein n=1 Tax=Trametes coccinea (strain BRFM310) TaxID=1353009 RepID=A0A1Y2J0X6_TRAC3|nr:hypothetical protein PYCCODRAFT_1403824 [Trametes coccinea BRFM310]
MTFGPPPSAAGPSGSAPPEQDTQSATGNVHQTTSATPSAPSASSAPGPSISTGPFTSQFSVQPQPAARPYYGRVGTNTYPSGYSTNAAHASSQQPSQQTPTTGHYPNYYAQHPQVQSAPQGQTGTYSYYSYPQNAWSNAWNANAYQYGAAGSYPYPYAQAQPAPQRSAPQATAPAPAAVQDVKEANVPPPTRQTPSPSIQSPSPAPPPEYHKDWDAVIKSFLSSIGFSQALRGFEADMIVLNPEFERSKVPSALGQLMKDLLSLDQNKVEGKEPEAQERPLEERKLDYVHVAEGFTPRSQTSITKDISRFLARNRARNDASNRNEFLLSLAEKRRRLNENGEFVSSEPIPSCARTDAKTQNRDLQMKYDIAKNEDGPLRRTLKSGAPAAAELSVNASVDNTMTQTEIVPTAERYPALDERLQNIEKHIAIRYVPSPPRSLLDRLKFLEDHLIHLEKEYPPWAALHFNQPNRGWPPPPRPTPIIVPSHMRTTSERETVQATVPSTSSAPAPNPGQSTGTPASENAEGAAKGKSKGGRNTKSSLHRAVMERLEVQKAISDFTSGDGG